jgi:DNA-binding NtrC family response regulator
MDMLRTSLRVTEDSVQWPANFFRNAVEFQHSLAARMPAARPQLLVIEPNDVARRRLQLAVSALADVEIHRQFETARARLSVGSFQFIVTNIRLGAYNGLHLAYVASISPQPPRVIVYSEQRDPGLAREAQRAGAFYEVGECLPVTLAAYLEGALPDQDRRSPEVADRRSEIRGGRRCWDVHLMGRTG